MQNTVLILAFCSMILNTFFRPLYGGVSVLFGYITIVLTLLYPILVSRRSGKIVMRRSTFALICVLIVSMATSLNDFSGTGIDSIVISILSFIALYWSLSLDDETAGIIDINMICKINYLLCIVLLLFGYGPFGFKYTEVGVWGYKIFTMGLGNPNTVAVYVMFAMMILLIQIGTFRRKIHIAINILLIGLLFYLLVLLSSRTVVACMIILLVEYIVAKRSKHVRIFWYFILACPILMIVIQLMLGNSAIGITLLGKALETGRSNMFKTLIAEIKQSPLSFVFGKVFRYQFENLHNAPLTIISNVGIVGLIIYLSIWFSKIKHLNDICNTRTQMIALYSILAFIIQSSSESLLMVGTIPYAVMVIIIDKVAKGEIADQSSLAT